MYRNEKRILQHWNRLDIVLLVGGEERAVEWGEWGGGNKSSMQLQKS